MHLPPTLKHYNSVGEHFVEKKKQKQIKQMQHKQPNIVHEVGIGWQLHQKVI